MNKEIMLSIQPKHLVNILNGKKTLELRKTAPKDYKGWVNIYASRGKDRLSVVHDDEICKTYYYLNSTWGRELNGEVVARFWFDEYDGIDYQRTVLSKSGYETLNSQVIIRVMGAVKYIFNDDILDKLCLTYDEVENYGKGKELYAWHIKKLEIFDTPLRLNDFYKATLYASGQVIKEYEKQTNDFSYRLKKAPQNYQFVYRKGE